MFLKLVLKGFKLKKLVVELKNGSTGCARPVEDRLREAKKFLSLPVTFSSQSMTSRGHVEANDHLPSI